MSPDAVDIQALWDYDDPAASEERFRAALDDAPAHRRAELLTQVARALGLQRRFDEARTTLDEAAALITEDAPRARVRLLLERGRLLNSTKRRTESRPFFREAWEVARAHGIDGLAVDAAHMLGIVEEPDAARTWNESALALARGSVDPDAIRWEGSLENNMGWSCHARGAFDEALVHFEAAARFRDERGTVSEQRIARWCVARCLRSLGRTPEALAIQRDLERTADDDGPGGFVCEEIAECLAELDRLGEARPYFARAHGLLAQDPWLAESEPQRIERLRRMAE